ncbi:vanadium-dependent haloperoxidase [Nonomuraea turcica]|uniref:vanadium-dependent haloperoxidase n=1 Tax=Nonomuraea sp. G32 TaxID=3067274 RepID=UPI00273BBE58|nr:vanadium-dependent haloperoxidase [Nonomuraea sp. G32]MDP4511482.1 vanadium-dependent haloperoxidase [Nonomuraea sp. G32]
MTSRITRLPLRLLSIVLGSALFVSAVAAPARPDAGAEPGTNTVLEWFDQTNASVAAPTMITNIRTWVISWTAAGRAIGSHANGVYAEAALASAVHDSLASIAPQRKNELDAALNTTLARLPEGPAKTRGVEAGRVAAAKVLAEREGDGLDPASVNEPFTAPPAAPGVWQPTPPAFGPATQAGQGKGKTFLLGRSDRFRPEPPPSVTSARYARDFAETKAYGSADSTVRTPWQTNIALLYRPAILSSWTQILRQVLTDGTNRSIRDSARLLATFHAVTGDAYIAVYDAKYAYLAWRPVTAIRQAGTDGNPRTEPDANWMSLFPAPDNPEYPSGHNGYAGAAAAVMTRLLGPAPARPVTLASPDAPGFVRTYTSWAQTAEDVINTRVWSGLHFRTSDEAGIRLGEQIAQYDLARLNW